MPTLVGMSLAVSPRSVRDMAQLFRIFLGRLESLTNLPRVVGQVQLDVLRTLEVFGSGTIVARKDDKRAIRQIEFV